MHLKRGDVDLEQNIVTAIIYEVTFIGGNL